MPVIVQKYGGTSVGDVERIRHVARKVKATRDAGNQVVVVVSARAGVTNELIARAKQLNAVPDDREMDMLLAVGEQETIALLAIALHGMGVAAVSRTGGQAGIQTDARHTRARITRMDGSDLNAQLAAGHVVIVAGFQGVNESGEITTLGRGGSDLTAIALAHAVKADMCEIYTDVEGVFTADPRIVPNARKLEEIAYEELLELASSGSKVMQARSVEFAEKYNVPFEVRSSMVDKPGTVVKAEVPSMEDVVVRGVALARDQVKIALSELPDQPGVAARVFEVLGREDVVVDMIIQNMGRGGRANITFTVAKEDLHRAEAAVNKALSAMGGGTVKVAGDVAKLSVVGVGMRSHSGVAAKLFGTLAEAGVNIQMISTSEIKISVAIDPAQADEAVRRVHAAFALDRA